jgi:hypothetical protein
MTLSNRSSNLYLPNTILSKTKARNRYGWFGQQSVLLSVFFCAQLASKYQKHKKKKSEDKQAVKEASKKAKKAKVRAMELFPLPVFITLKA